MSDSTVKGAEKNAASFAQSLMGIFQRQFAGQSDILSFLTGKLKDVVNRGGEGFDNSTLAAARTRATETVAQQYQNAQKALQQKRAINGDANLPSGVYAQQDEALANSAAGETANEQNDITLQNAQAKQQSYQNAINALANTASLYNPTGLASAANQGSGVVANLSEANTAAQSQGFWSQFKNAFGATLGKTFGGGNRSGQ